MALINIYDYDWDENLSSFLGLPVIVYEEIVFRWERKQKTISEWCTHSTYAMQT